MEDCGRAVPGGFIVWFTGLSGAGKSTLANALRHELAASRAVQVLDGDDVRRSLSGDLGYSRADRFANVSRVGCVAALLASNGIATVVALISPYRDGRAAAREYAVVRGIPFLEVYVSASLDTVIARDTKGLYRRALAGELANFTGISDPYEPPESPDLTICTDREGAEASTARVTSLLRALRLIA